MNYYSLHRRHCLNYDLCDFLRTMICGAGISPVVGACRDARRVYLQSQPQDVPIVPSVPIVHVALFLDCCARNDGMRIPIIYMYIAKLPADFIYASNSLIFNF